jgi:hypothetical protein
VADQRASSFTQIEAVMCIAETRQNPSATPLFLTSASTWSVMLTRSRRCLVEK